MNFPRPSMGTQVREIMRVHPDHREEGRDTWTIDIIGAAGKSAHVLEDHAQHPFQHGAFQFNVGGMAPPKLREGAAATAIDRIARRIPWLAIQILNAAFGLLIWPCAWSWHRRSREPKPLDFPAQIPCPVPLSCFRPSHNSMTV